MEYAECNVQRGRTLSGTRSKQKMRDDWCKYVHLHSGASVLSGMYLHVDLAASSAIGTRLIGCKEIKETHH
jgi:hypothetical protein